MSKNITEELIKEKFSLINSLKDVIEVSGKILLGVVAMCYALGLVVVNIYLSRFGAFSLGLFRVNYVMAGIWNFLFLLIPGLFILSLTLFILLLIPSLRQKLFEHFALRDNVAAGNRRLRWLPTIILILLSINVAFMLYTRFENAGGLAFRKLWPALVTGAVVTFYLILFPMFVAVTHPQRSARMTAGALLTIIVICFLLAHTWDFAAKSYGSIPSYLGGGKPTDVKLVVNTDDNARQYLQSLGVHFQENTNVTANLKMILATEDEYILLVENSDAEAGNTVKGVSIRRDIVQAILYEEVQGRNAFVW